MLEQLELHRLALGDQHRVVAQLDGQRPDPCVDAAPHLVVRGLRDVGEEAFDAGEDLVEHAVVDGLGNPPRRLLIEPVAQHRPVVVEEADKPAHHAVEHPLVMSALDGDVDRLAEEGGDLGGLQPLLDSGSECLLDVAVVEHLDDAAECIGSCFSCPFGTGRLGQPAAEALGDPRPGEPLTDDLRREEVALHEVAEAAADVVLALGDDRRVRDRDAERVAEQRRDGKPVGECADHRRLGGGLDVADPRRLVLERPGDDEHDGGEHQQGRREKLHPPQIADARWIGSQRVH